MLDKCRDIIMLGIWDREIEKDLFFLINQISSLAKYVLNRSNCVKLVRWPQYAIFHTLRENYSVYGWCTSS